MNYSPAIDALTTGGLASLCLALAVVNALDEIFAARAARMFSRGGRGGGQ